MPERVVIAKPLMPWWRRRTGCWDPWPGSPPSPRERSPWADSPPKCLSVPRPHKVLHERFNPANPYLYRWRIWPWLTWLTLGLVTANLHRIVRPDDDPDPHDHPWLFWFGVILEGGYDEDRWAVRDDGPPLVYAALRRPGSWFFHGRHLHRIDRLAAAESWSLVFMGPKVREWGFVDRVKGCWTAWRPYIRGERC